MQKDNTVYRVPAAGVVYGQITFWLVLLGMVIALVGSVLCLASNGSHNSPSLFEYLWKGDDINVIWQTCIGFDGPPHGHWYLGVLPGADGVAMLGIAISCMAAVLGMWGASAAMLRNRDRVQVLLSKLYFVFALAVAVILSLSALGIIALE